MSDEKGKVTDKASEIAKNIWLAGVGAYGRAVDEAQDRLEKAGVETPRLFKDLVKAGAKLEEEARTQTRSTRSSVEERIHRVRENFHNQRHARIEDVADIQAKLDLLSRKLDRLATALTEAGVIEAPKKTRATRKSPAKARSKSAAKESAKPARKSGRGARSRG